MAQENVCLLFPNYPSHRGEGYPPIACHQLIEAKFCPRTSDLPMTKLCLLASVVNRHLQALRIAIFHPHPATSSVLGQTILSIYELHQHRDASNRALLG